MSKPVIFVRFGSLMDVGIRRLEEEGYAVVLHQGDPPTVAPPPFLHRRSTWASMNGDTADA